MQSTRVDGTVLVIEARLSINLNSLTIEQVPFFLPVSQDPIQRDPAPLSVRAALNTRSR